MLELQNAGVSFGDKSVLSGCTLSLAPGERIALMGPSGCGKTTLLRTALGLQVPDDGAVGNTFSRPAAVFQEERLFPWLRQPVSPQNPALYLPYTIKLLPKRLFGRLGRSQNLLFPLNGSRISYLFAKTAF